MSNPLENRQNVLVRDVIGTDYSLPEDAQDLLADFLWEGSVDAYCPDCKRLSVFQLSGPGYPRDEHKAKIPKFGLVTAEAKCKRESQTVAGYPCGHSLFAFFRRKDCVFVKIGQDPSRAANDFGLLESAFGELSEEYRKELGRAIGLRAHSVGIGSFVYLRRIFEHLVEEAHVQAQSAPDWDADAYKRSRMDDKIKMLKGWLPSRLVEARRAYSILSKGIHELSEQACLDRFDLLYQAIRFILSERREQKEHDRLVKDLEAD